MRFTSPLFILSSITASAFAAFNPPSAPHSYFIMSGVVDITTPVQIANPLGTRVSIAWTGGNFTDWNGNVFATVVPGAGGENGLVDSTGFLHLDARLTLKLVNENDTYAYLQHLGIGQFGAVDYVYLRIETNSVKYNFLNQIFVWGNATVPGTYLLVDAFSPTKPT
ncbi:hypothetical protein M407DRAFT_17798 [Tulasnella calospora MUT 4182]|uniref:Uncharacterized protein n=1 Tax=Tulasnella calospora MUT 4182 TaxID=1051891 RepID=A0A0C3QUV1_9AGAM|nr:hypothetical protein M407DRAFT_17798 [Tulasnella calospora MUT 4182]